MIKNIFNVLLLIIFSYFLTGCAGSKMTEIPLVKKVDIAKFMGDWYVIAVIPTAIETEAHNAIENYKLNDDGSIATTFTLIKVRSMAKLKSMSQKVLSAQILVTHYGACNLFGQLRRSIVLLIWMKVTKPRLLHAMRAIMCG